MTVGEELRRAEARLAEARVPTPRADAEFLVGHVVGLTRAELALRSELPLSDDQHATLEALVDRRAVREPLQYVLGEWGFRRLSLAVDRRALVPRPETETVVERCLVHLDGKTRPRVLDVGTGSGAIALAIADEHEGAVVLGVDASAEALSLAQENAHRTGLPIELRRHDLFEGLPDGPWDVVVSNPPYVAPEDIGALAAEIRDWEPHEALIGTGATEAIASRARDVLVPGGALVLEVADGTAARVGDLLRGLGYREVRATSDLTGRDRVVEGLV